MELVWETRVDVMILEISFMVSPYSPKKEVVLGLKTFISIINKKSAVRIVIGRFGL